MTQEALKLALEVLEDLPGFRADIDNAIAAIKEVLAQPAQEPVAWMYDWLCDGKLITGWIAHSESEIPKSMAFNIRPLYTAPPQPAQKPKSFTYNEVADAMNSFRKGNSVQKAYAEEVGKLKLYAAPPQRPWVELEGEEIRNLWEEATKPDRSTVTMVTSFARAIEAKLKEKNNGA